MPKFNQDAYNDCDSRAKEVLRKYLDSRGIFTKVFEDYGADIQAFHEYFHEVEIKSSWDSSWPESWKTLHIPARKKKLLSKGKGYFWVMNKTCTKAKLVESTTLDDVFIENIPNSRYPKGEYFYNIPIHLTTEIIL
tara:strand:- start:1205 stop:1612 length:408 start_codon:yes stop_codon:yes gene_type:complete